MGQQHILVWNTRGLNSLAHRSAVRDLVINHRASVVCLQETKLAMYDVRLNNEVAGSEFDYAYLPAVGASGGAIICWRRDTWGGSDISVRQYSVTLRLSPFGDDGQPWWITNVYGPTAGDKKPAFLQELRDIRASVQGSWLLCGDFNQIYMASDKNNARLNRGEMRHFKNVLNDLEVDELQLTGRLYTWSNHREQPTLERIDRAFATTDWLADHPSHQLRCLSSDASDHASDHAPLLPIHGDLGKTTVPISACMD